MEPDFGALAVWPKEADRGRQKRHRAQERDQHTDAGDQPQLRDAAELGRHKSEKARRRSSRGHQNLPADPAARLSQRTSRFGKHKAHLAIADRELNREIHGDADKEDAEADRDEVQRPDRNGGEQQGQHQADPQGHQDRGDQPPGVDGQEQPQRDQHEAPDQSRCRTLGHGREFLVGERHVSRDAYSGISRFDEFEIARGVAHRSCRRSTRLEGGVVEFGLHQDKFVAAAEIGQLAAEQAYPGKRVRMAGERARHRLVKPRQRRAVRREVDLALLDAGAEQGERIE